jgi:branched-chain amino acid transport system permease protein
VGLIGKYGGPGLLIVVAALLPVLVQGFWVGLVAQAFAYGIIFLSFTLVTGEGGMIWLCQITFAGVGGLTASQLATNHGWPILAAIVVGGLVALPMGLLIGFLTIRLGDLYVALVTLTFGLLMENLVFTIGIFTNGGLGVNVNRPSFAVTDHAFAYVCLVAFAILALFILNLRRSTTGLALNAVRWSPPGARTLGISVVQMKIIVAGLGAMVAGIGGGFLVAAQTSAQPANFATFLGVIWLAALVTIGIRSNAAALVAGLTFTMLPALALAYLPSWTGQLPPILFGLGAIGVAKFPDGSLEQSGEMFRRWLYDRVARRSSSSGAPGAGGGLAGRVLHAPSVVPAHVVEEVPS